MNPSRLNKIRVLLVDDHPFVIEGIRSYLNTLDHIEVVGEALNGHDALGKARKLRPDIVLMDISMPKLGGLETTRQLHGEMPGVKVVAFSAHDNREYVLEMIQAGASGYVLKDSSPDELVEAIESVSAGNPFFSPRASRRLATEYVVIAARQKTELSDREVEILRLIAEGASGKLISAKLEISLETVWKHRQRIMDKIGDHTLAGMIRYAVAHGFVERE